MYSNFLLGRLIVSAAAKRALGRTPLDLIARHAINDHGLIAAHQRARNLKSMRDLGEIVSRYQVDPTNPRAGFVLVRTEPCWGKTTIIMEKPCRSSSSSPEPSASPTKPCAPQSGS